MTVVVCVPGHEPWKVANWAFRALIERAGPKLREEGDRYALVQAAALNGLHLDSLEPRQQTRLAAALAEAADDLRAQHLWGQDAKDRAFADALGDLCLLLSDVVNDGG